MLGFIKTAKKVLNYQESHRVSSFKPHALKNLID
jgi:hypothetical protein